VTTSQPRSSEPLLGELEADKGDLNIRDWGPRSISRISPGSSEPDLIWRLTDEECRQSLHEHAPMTLAAAAVCHEDVSNVDASAVIGCEVRLR
jgi:hypothetical protein